ncbi:MAG: hypothetical protein ACR2M6_01660 [Vampirovibrionia bacterium]
MPSKKQRAKVKSNKPNVAPHRVKMDNKDDKSLFNLGRSHYLIQEMLSRPRKRFNLLLTTDEGDWLTTEDSLMEGNIMGRLKRLAEQNEEKFGGWMLLYVMETIKMDDDKTFFFYANLRDVPEVNKFGQADPYEYVYWKETTF